MKFELTKEELEALIKESIAQGKKIANFKFAWFGDWSRKVEAISCKVEFEEGP